MQKKPAGGGIPRGRKPGPSTGGASSWVWSPPLNFGGYLSGLRGTRRLSLRAAAEQLGVSFAYLHKLENEPLANPLDLGLLSRIAETYRQNMQEVVEAAGMRVRVTPLDPKISGVRDQFRRLLLDPGGPKLAAHDLTELDMAHLPDKHMRWMVQAIVNAVDYYDGLHDAPRLVRKTAGIVHIDVVPAGCGDDLDES